ACELAHRVEHVCACRRARRKGFQRQGGGKMRGRSLETHVLEFAAVSLGQRGHGARNFLLPVCPRADDKRLQVLEFPTRAVGGSSAAAARNPAEIVYVKRERGREIQISLEGKELGPVSQLAQEPLHRRML